MGNALDRWGGVASMVAGVLWLLLWAHQQAAHGATQVNEMHLVAGLTWIDSGKAAPIILSLVLVGLASLYRRRSRPGRLGRIGATLTFVAMGCLIIATAIEFWPFPWGSYAVTFEIGRGPRGSDASGGLQALASLAVGVGLIILMIDLVRARVVPVWAAIAIVLGALTTVFISPAFLLPALAWFALGFVVLRAARTSEPSPTA